MDQRSNRRAFRVAKVYSSFLGLITCSLGFWGCSHSLKSSRPTLGFDQAANFDPIREMPRFDEILDNVTMRAQADFHFAVGESYSQVGLIPQAVEAFRAALVFDPGSIQLRLRLAQELAQAGSFTQAMKLIESSLEDNPNHYGLLVALGGICASTKNYPKALEVYGKAKRINPLAPEPVLYLGALYAEKGQFEKALREFQDLAKMTDWDRYHLAYFYQGRVFEEQKSPDWVRAEKSYRGALRIKPSHLESALSLASLLIKQNRRQEARELLAKWNSDHGPVSRVADVLLSLYLADNDQESALAQLQILELDREYVIEARNQMAQIYYNQQRFEELAKVLQKIVADIPDADRTWYLLGITLAELKRNDEAIAAFQAVPPGTSLYRDSTTHIAALLREQGKIDLALAHLEAQMKIKDDPEFYVSYGAVVSDSRSKKSGLQVMQRGAELFPEHPNVLFFLGVVLDRAGNKEGMISQLKKVIELQPDHVQALNYLAYTYAELDRDLPQALKWSTEALRLSPNDGYVLDTMGWVLFKQGQYSEAVRYLERAFDLKPREPVIAEHLGDAYSRMQMFERARKAYEHALSMTEDQAQVRTVQTKLSDLQKLVQRPILESGNSLGLGSPERAPASAP